MDVLSAFVFNLMAVPGSDESWAVGTVTSVSTGAAEDGNALVAVNWRGAIAQVAYAASYTPAPGHVVLMARVKSSLAIVCQLIGTPPTGTF